MSKKIDPNTDWNEPHRCTATNRAGKQCGKYAIRGGTVCVTHGGGAPQVRRKAQLRLLELVDPAIATLAKEMIKAQKSSDRQRAANSILDRAGIPRSSASPDAEVARQALINRLLAMKAEISGNPAAAEIDPMNPLESHSVKQIDPPHGDSVDAPDDESYSEYETSRIDLPDDPDEPDLPDDPDRP